ncbi:MAG: hypothetical protein A3B44_00050 [Candidatus Levybacteria bacterium RIFCSPLOWO2_01_FULL_38_21]|nr:MAG: hypothetical protein A3B44_00050 [Candidatus Levybacteria bacterium RIFCSPLOWO2_01_FULL_38_21]
MRIDGRGIAQDIFSDLKIRVGKLKKKGITPHLHIITLTTDSASQAYVGQKKLKGEEIGAKITVENLDSSISTKQLLKKIEKLNKDPLVHGIIIQRPLTAQINEQKIAESINPKKDVDGFHPNSKFSPPVGEAVLRILEEIHSLTSEVDVREPLRFTGWLRSKKISVIGRGVTAGTPIIKTLVRIGVQPLIVASQTQNRAEILKNSDIIICTVGKPNILAKSDIKKGAILVGVGMYRGKDSKLHSDYEEDDIKDIASFYTPTPGGVGPVNVAMLLKNLLKAAENQFLSK